MFSLIRIWIETRDWFGWAWDEFWRLFKDSGILHWGLVLGAVSFIYKLLDFPLRLVNWLLLRLQDIDISSFDFSKPTGAHQILALANTFFPLEEGFKLLAAYVVIYCFFIIYRKIKAWIPLMGGD